MNVAWSFIDDFFIRKKKAAQKLGGILSRRCIRLDSDRFRIICNINVATVFRVFRAPFDDSLRRWLQLIAGKQLKRRRVERVHVSLAYDSCIRHGGRPLVLLHLISVRTRLVRTECYYIWYAKASKPLYLEAY